MYPVPEPGRMEVLHGLVRLSGAASFLGGSRSRAESGQPEDEGRAGTDPVFLRSLQGNQDQRRPDQESSSTCPGQMESVQKLQQTRCRSGNGHPAEAAEVPGARKSVGGIPLDQEINDRGIAIDLELARQAVALDAQSRKSLMAALKERTGLENPNSVLQMLNWLEQHGMKTDSLGKKNVQELLKTAQEPLRSVLWLRQKLAKSSVKKYQAMEMTACKDGRARGMFQFYGANRTGRFCLTGDHEVLTDTGWKRLDSWKGGRIAVWNANSCAVSFQAAKQVSFDYNGKCTRTPMSVSISAAPRTTR